MEEPQNSVYHQKEEEKNPFLGFFTSLFSAIKLPFPQQNKKNDGVKVEPAAFEPFRIQPDEVDIVNYNDVGYVSFPRYSHRFASLKLEAEAEEAEGITNPVVLWQAYAIGGYYILRWAWMKWNARRGQNDEPPPALE